MNSKTHVQFLHVSELCHLQQNTEYSESQYRRSLLGLGARLSSTATGGWDHTLTIQRKVKKNTTGRNPPSQTNQTSTKYNKLTKYLLFHSENLRWISAIHIKSCTLSFLRYEANILVKIRVIDIRTYRTSSILCLYPVYFF